MSSQNLSPFPQFHFSPLSDWKTLTGLTGALDAARNHLNMAIIMLAGRTNWLREHDAALHQGLLTTLDSQTETLYATERLAMLFSGGWSPVRGASALTRHLERLPALYRDHLLACLPEITPLMLAETLTLLLHDQIRTLSGYRRQLSEYAERLDDALTEGDEADERPTLEEVDAAAALARCVDDALHQLALAYNALLALDTALRRQLGQTVSQTELALTNEPARRII